MKPWQTGLVKERNALAKKLEKLRLFLDNQKEFNKLSPLAQHQLKLQYGYMVGYAGVLNERIVMF